MQPGYSPNIKTIYEKTVLNVQQLTNTAALSEESTNDELFQPINNCGNFSKRWWELNILKYRANINKDGNTGGRIICKCMMF